MAPRGTDKLEAYDYYLRGWQYFLTGTREGYPKAREMWERAIQLDPKYAEAYVGVGFTYLLEGRTFQSTSSSQAFDQAYQWAQKAITLNDAEPGAYMILGLIDLMKRHYDQAISEAQRAVALAPNLVVGYFWLANILIYSGRPMEAVEAAEKGVRLNPRHPEICLSQVSLAYQSMGRWKEARTILEETSLANVPNPGPHAMLAIDDVELGRNDDARAAAAEILRLSPHFSLATFQQAFPLKDSAMLQRWLADLRKAGLK
jgi:tetratricopeptide (TPR) repeat protein